MCCSHHIGLAFRNHYKKCFNNCEDLIKGIKNDDKVYDKTKEVKI